MVFLVSFVWMILCMIAILLSVAARREPRFYSSDGIISKPLMLWFVSMFVLDIAVFSVGIWVGYKPVSFFCIMFLSIQWVYIISIITVRKKFRTEGTQFDEVRVSKLLRGAPVGSSSISTVFLAVSLGLISFDETLPLLLILFGTGMLFSGLDFLFLRFLELRRSR